MFAVRLSSRLEAMARSVPPGAHFVDVGTDHALLPIYLVQHGIVTHAIGTEVALGPYTAAKKNVLAAGLGDRVDIRLGDGLAPIRPGEASVINIAGMGGGTMVGILSRSMKVVISAERLVLQPMNAGDAVRRFLYEHAMHLVSEAVQMDEGRSYEMIVASVNSKEGPDPSYLPFVDDRNWLDLAFLFGPRLLADPSDAFIDRVRATTEHLERIVHQLAESTQGEAIIRRKNLQQQLTLISIWMDKIGLNG